MTTPAQMMAKFTVADAGILAAALDDFRHLGDNATVDELTDVIFYNEIATGLAEQLAYHIVHDLGRKVETPTAVYCRTWSRDGSHRITVTIPKD